MNLSPEERQLATAAQTALNAAKAALSAPKTEMRAAVSATREIMKVQKDAGRQQAHADAYAVVVAMRDAMTAIDLALDAVHRAHSVATTALAKTYEDGGIVAFGGAGR